MGRGTLRRMAERWQLYVLILPAIVAVLIFHYIPIYGVQIAFRDYNTRLGITGSTWVGLKHFMRFINFPDFWPIMRNTVCISLYSLATFPCPVIFALMLNEVRSHKLKTFIQTVSFAPHFISTVVVCSMLNLFLKRDYGLLNNVFALFGGERVDFLTQPAYFRTIYVLSGIWQEMGWSAIVYIASLSNVSPELYEAARVDGANRVEIIWHINIPTILPTVVIMLILSTGSLLSVGFEKVYLLQNTLNLSVSTVISTYVYEIGLKGGQFSYSAAIGLFNNAVNVVFIMIVNAIAKRVTETSLW